MICVSSGCDKGSIYRYNNNNFCYQH